MDTKMPRPTEENTTGMVLSTCYKQALGKAPDTDDDAQRSEFAFIWLLNEGFIELGSEGRDLVHTVVERLKEKYADRS